MNVLGSITASAGISASGGVQGLTLKAAGLTQNRVPIVGSGGSIQDTSNFTFSSNLLSVPELITGLSGIPIENHFGAGTQYSHFEEGLYENFTPEIRKDSNGIVHPSIPTEIMTGFLDDIYTGGNDPWYSNYISRISLGILQDIGFGVNYDSIYVQNPPADQIYTTTSASQN